MPRCPVLPQAAVALVAVLATVAARAQEAVPANGRPELRLGIFAHDPGGPEQGTASANAEVLVPLPVPPGPWSAFVPRVQAGATASLAGRTSHAYAGLAWTVDVTAALFAEASVGAALTNGAAGAVVPADRSDVGCRAAFRESASLGLRVTAQLSVMATVEHLSNAGLCSGNRGLTHVGMRMGYRF